MTKVTGKLVDGEEGACMEHYTLADPWRDAATECDCGWRGPGSASISYVEETYATHHCPQCDTQLFRVIFYIAPSEED